MPLATAANLISVNDVRLSAVSGAPATEDAAGYAALTYVPIGAVQSFGEIGPQSAINTFQLIGADSVAKRPAAIDYGEFSVTVFAVDDGDDDGQALLRAEAESAAKTMHSFKLEFLNTGGTTNNIIYFGGYVSSGRYSLGDSNAAASMNATVALSKAWVRVDATG